MNKGRIRKKQIKKDLSKYVYQTTKDNFSSFYINIRLKILLIKALAYLLFLNEKVK